MSISTYNYIMLTEATIIIVSYNSAALFLSNRKAFLEITRFEVIIVDSASSDGSRQDLFQAFTDISR